MSHEEAKFLDRCPYCNGNMEIEIGVDKVGHYPTLFIRKRKDGDPMSPNQACCDCHAKCCECIKALSTFPGPVTPEQQAVIDACLQCCRDCCNCCSAAVPKLGATP